MSNGSVRPDAPQPMKASSGSSAGRWAASSAMTSSMLTPRRAASARNRARASSGSSTVTGMTHSVESVALRRTGRFWSAGTAATEDLGRDDVCGLDVEAGHDVAVGVERDRDRRVAESLGHDFGVNAGLERERGPGVAQTVRPPQTRQSGGTGLGLELLGEPIGMQRLPVELPENKVGLALPARTDRQSLFVLASPVVTQHCDCLGIEGDAATTARRL